MNTDEIRVGDAVGFDICVYLCSPVVALFFEVIFGHAYRPTSWEGRHS
jgi:hypothetical protein